MRFLKNVLQIFSLKVLMLFLGFSITTYCLAQQTVTGKVIDSSTTLELPNINITVKGTERGTITDGNGNFTILASRGDVLVISAVNYVPQEITVQNSSAVNIALVSNNAQLNEVVVIGYGQRQRRDVTGSIASVSAREIEKSTAPSAELAMQGRMAGVFVSTPSGNPNDRASVRIRGVNTFNGVNDPLFVVDGVPLTEGGVGTRQAVLQDLRTPINIFSMIDPNDIESISVLKDASAAAIYGVRASNGVVLITTKRGRTGKPKIDLNSYYGIQNPTSGKKELLSTPQFVELYKEAYAAHPDMSGGLPRPMSDVFGPEWDPNSTRYLGNSPTIDWQEAYRNEDAPISNINLRLSGATEAFNYYVSGSFYKTEGTLVGSKLDRYSLATNLTTKVSKAVELGLTMRLVYEKNINEVGGSTNNGDLGVAFRASPWQRIYGDGPGGFAPAAYAEFVPNPSFDPDRIGNIIMNTAPGFDPPVRLWGLQTHTNGIAIMNLNDNIYHQTRGLGNVYVQITPLKGLRIRGVLGGDYFVTRNDNFSVFESWMYSSTPSNPYASLPYSRDTNIVANISTRNTYNISFEKRMEAFYNIGFGDHNVELTAVASEQQWEWKIVSGSGALFYKDPNLRNTSNSALVNSGGQTNLEKRALIGYIGRLSYRFNDKYYVDASVRRDGSSRFAAENRWGTFPAVSVGWRISSERFFPAGLNWITDLKFRANWGKLGNEQTTEGWAYISLVNPGITVPNYSFGSGNGNGTGGRVLGAYLPSFANRNLSWETLTTSGVGFDAMLFNNRVNFTLEYYNKINTDIIQSVEPPSSTGIERNTDINVAEVRNRGIEVVLGYTNRFGPVNFSASANFTSMSNEVLKLNNGVPFSNNVREGYPIGFIYGYRMGGIFQNQAEIDAYRAVYTDPNVSEPQKPGDIYFLDIQSETDPKNPSEFNKIRDSVVDNNDQTYLGNTIPGYFYGFNANASYKGFDISVFFQGVGDVQNYNFARASGESMSSNGINQWVSVLNRWTPTNPSTTMPRAVYGDPSSNNRMSDRFVEDAGFLRLKNIQIGYSFPRQTLQRIGFIEGIRLYVSGTNLFTITEWEGLDPENDFFPPAKQVMVGLNLNF